MQAAVIERPASAQRAAPALPERDSADSLAARIGRLPQVWPEDVVTLINAISSAVARSNGHLADHRSIVTQLDQLSDSITAVLEGRAECL
jgi:hypothetical protein